MSSRISAYDLAVGLRFLLRLPFFFRPRLDEATACRIVHQRLATRAASFLHLVGSAIYAREHSPSCRLLRQTDITYPEADCGPGPPGKGSKGVYQWAVPERVSGGL